jgi:hypothetical protein
VLGFPWIPLAESGFFNRLRRIQIKKSFPASPQLEMGPNAFPSPFLARRTASVQCLFDGIAEISAFLNKLRTGFSWPPSASRGGRVRLRSPSTNPSSPCSTKVLHDGAGSRTLTTSGPSALPLRSNATQVERGIDLRATEQILTAFLC